MNHCVPYLGKVSTRVGQHADLACGVLTLPPGSHHKHIVDCHARNNFNSAGLQLVIVVYIARQVGLGGGGGGGGE